MNTENSEIWKPIEGFDNYQVSNLGRVKSTIHHNGTNERILKPLLKKDGYLQIVLYKHKISKRLYIHRLVAAAFLPNPNNLPCVNHKNENPQNNMVVLNKDGSVNVELSNLEWCDYTYNNNYGTRNERLAKTKSKIVLQYSLDGTFIKEYPSIREVERQLGFAQGNISHCCLGKYNQAYGYKWLYKED